MTDKVMVSEIDEEDIKRDGKGRVKKGYSLNPKGRPKGSVSKVNEARLTNLMNKYGPYCAEKIVELADKEDKKGNSATAIKAYAIVFAEFAKMVDKQKAADLKEATKKLVDDQEEDDSPEIRPVEFSMSVNA